ncbi:MAG: Rieske (2Fe-2S) protein [Chloroflexi bacterium]|nr:Rieske (2Fe-2S) protein [Chloroflexota bacterium]
MLTASETGVRIYNLGPLEQVPLGEGRAFLVGSTPVAVFRPRNGKVYATQALCTHKGGPLADGLLGGETLVCPLHAYRFNLATGQPVGHECSALRTYAVVVGPDGCIRLALP